MAKKQAKVTTGKLQGKTVALVGKFGYKDWHREKYAAQVRAAGGTIVDAGKTIPEILLVGEGRGGKPPGDVAKLQKKSPALEVLDLAAFYRLFLPSPEELLGEIAKGTKARGDDNHVFWENLQHSCREAGVQIDLTKADLRKADLYGAHLEGIHLNGSDLRGAK